MTDLSIIILSYKSKEDLKVLLPSVFSSQTKYSYEVIVVDNGSNDGIIEWLRVAGYELKVVENTNNGFAAGNNLGINQSTGKYILLLNPDTRLETNTLEIMLDFMELHPETGISGPKIVKPDGSLDLAARRRFPNVANSFKRLFLLDRTNYNYTDTDENKSMEVDSVVGAFLLIRKSVIDKIGLLDEKFFMYGEDLDWCWRAKEAGFKIWYCPKTFITHYKGASSEKTAFRALKWFHESMWIFYKKHYAKKSNPFTNALVFFGIYLRLGVLIFINLFRAKPKVSK